MGLNENGHDLVLFRIYCPDRLGADMLGTRVGVEVWV